MMSSDQENVDQPYLPAGVFPDRNPSGDRSQLLKGGFLAWYDRVVSRPYDLTKCQLLVNDTLKHPALKLLTKAIESSGCKFDIANRVSCEPCNSNVVLGAYDPRFNQVVVCANVCRRQNDAFAVLGYNLIQMFDACRAHVDFRNIDHVACTEVRANNLFMCGSYKEGRQRKVAPLFNYEGRQKECVRTQAILSVQQMMGVDGETARAAVDRVFGRCYTDLEPFGQHFENEHDAEILYERRRNYGYY